MFLPCIQTWNESLEDRTSRLKACPPPKDDKIQKIVELQRVVRDSKQTTTARPHDQHKYKAQLNKYIEEKINKFVRISMTSEMQNHVFTETVAATFGCTMQPT